jgi:hypothetical protein
MTSPSLVAEERKPAQGSLPRTGVASGVAPASSGGPAPGQLDGTENLPRSLMVARPWS